MNNEEVKTIYEAREEVFLKSFDAVESMLKRVQKIISLVCLTFLLITIIQIGGILYFLSSYAIEVEDTVTTTTEQIAEGDNAEINNIEGNQYKDNSTHNEGVDD